MDVLLKTAAYIIFIAGSVYFFFGGTRKPSKGKSKRQFGVIMTISIILLSYYYWFRI